MADHANNTPQDHQGFYFDPPLHTWKEQASRNRDFLSKQSFWGLTPRSVRDALKLPLERPLVLSGHQPVFFHPGLWAKCLAASALAESLQGMALHKITDSSLMHEHMHYAPEVEEDGKARKRTLDFYSIADAKKLAKVTPVAFLPSPDESAIRKIFADARIHSPKSVQYAMANYEDKMVKGLKGCPEWSDYHLATLKMLDEICGTHRLCLNASRLWDSDAFMSFVAYWLLNLPALTDFYNQSLNEYRKIHHIDHKLEPLPNLKFEDWWFEIPFWGITKHRHRQSLWAKNDGKQFTLKVKGAEGMYPVALATFQEDLAALPLKIWPKALPQTLFCRLFLCDFFVHGMGGRTYEEVNDRFFEKAFKQKAPAFGTATATYWVEADRAKQVEGIARFEPKLEWWQRALEKNPETLFTKAQAWKAELPELIQEKFEPLLERQDLRELVREKEKCVENLKDPAQKIWALQRIGEINETLHEQCTEPLVALEKGMQDIAKVKGLQKVLTFREYPFFCFSPETFVGMKERVQAFISSPSTAG